MIRCFFSKHVWAVDSQTRGKKVTHVDKLSKISSNIEQPIFPSLGTGGEHVTTDGLAETCDISSQLSSSTASSAGHFLGNLDSVTAQLHFTDR